jgi:signal peptidase I
MLMNRFLIVVALIVVCVIGAGFYFGFLRIDSGSVDGTSHITLTIEHKKLQETEKNAVEKASGKE